MDALRPRFPAISDSQWQQLADYCALLREWNEKINVVSRKDIDRLENKHLAPCLVPTHYLQLNGKATILDVGTGGGLPGIALAILYPQAQVCTVDSVGKKIIVVSDIAERLKLNNVHTKQARVESMGGEKFDFVTGRAVTALPRFLEWTHDRMRTGNRHSLRNGVLYWKGGELEPELHEKGLREDHLWPMQYHLGGLLEEEDLSGKSLLHIRAEKIWPLFKAPPQRKPKGYKHRKTFTKR